MKYLYGFIFALFFWIYWGAIVVSILFIVDFAFKLSGTPITLAQLIPILTALILWMIIASVLQRWALMRLRILLIEEKLQQELPYETRQDRETHSHHR